MLNDAFLEQNPQLKEGLAKVLTTKPFLTNPPEYTVIMSMAEFDSMNRMLVNTHQDAVQYYPTRSTPTLTLFPKGDSIVFINYNGSSFQLIPSYSLVPPLGQSLI